MIKKLDKGYNLDWNRWVIPYKVLFGLFYFNKCMLFREKTTFKITFSLPKLLYKAIPNYVKPLKEEDLPDIKFEK